MTPRSLSRGRGRTRSRTPVSDDYSRSPRRTISPRSPSRTPRRTAVRRSISRNGRRSMSYSRSPSRDRSASPAPRSTKVVIEKLTKNVTGDHLREIFGTFGPIRDLDMPMNRQFMTNRGTAYILYASEVDAETAIAHMHESQVDGAVINVSIVLPRRKFSPSPPLARRGANIDPRGPPPGNFRGPPPSGRRRSPIRDHGRPDRGNSDVYRPRSFSRSRSPRRHRTRSRSYSSRSRSPRRRGGGRNSPERNSTRRRRSPSYSSYSSYDDRSRSRSRGRGGRGRR